MVNNLQGIVSGNAYTNAAAVEAARGALWNGAVDPKPYALLECRSVQDVRQAARFASEQGCGASVLGGGHDWDGRAVIQDGVVLDLRPLSSVAPDPATMTVAVGGGARTSDLVGHLPEHLVTVTGTISSVGVVGLTLGGGYGKLNSRFGLALDNLRSAQVVLADGSVVIADEQHESDLFWALRGGGGNFGIVTSLSLAMHEVSAVLTAMISIPLKSAKAGLLGLQRVLDDAPDALSIFSALSTNPAGERCLFLGPLWSGDEATGERYIDALAHLPGAAVLARGWSPYAKTFDLEAEKAWPKGKHYHLDSWNLPRIDATAAEILVESIEAGSPAATHLVIHDFHGAPSRVAPGATAFPLRQDHFTIEIISMWDPGSGDDSTQHIEWTKAVAERLSPLALPGGYTNLLGSGETQRVRQFYGDAVSRLSAVKMRVDPANMFRSNTGRF